MSPGHSHRSAASAVNELASTSSFRSWSVLSSPFAPIEQIWRRLEAPRNKPGQRLRLVWYEILADGRKDEKDMCKRPEIGQAR